MVRLAGGAMIEAQMPSGDAQLDFREGDPVDVAYATDAIHLFPARSA